VREEAARRGTPLRMIVVDYLQLLDGTAGGKRSPERREREIAYASLKLKGLAKELGLPVVLLAQLNEDARRDKRPPRKEDLRECKAVAHDADKVILIHNQAANERAAARRRGEDVFKLIDGEPVDLIVDKNRGGPTGTVGAVFFPSYTLFADATEADHRAAEA
jgi:replicative DNA helicase